MLAVNIAVLVSGGGTNLQALLDAQTAGVLKSGGISLVVSDNPAAYALERAAAHGVQTVVIERAAQDFEDRLNDCLATHDIQLIVLAGFVKILSERFTRLYPKRIINIHPSLIPAFCGQGYYGLSVHSAVLGRGVKLTGATVHFVNEVPDGGEIIAQKAVRVKKSDTPETLQRRVMEQAEWKLLPAACERVARDILKEASNGRI